MKHAFFSGALLAAGLLLAPATYAQQQPRPTPGSATASGVERDLRIFSDWVNDKLDRAEASARREMPKVTAEFDRQSRRLDRAVDSLTAESKREYSTQKARYQRWATRQDSLDQAARRPETAQQAQRRLLNEDVNISRARPTELPDLYLRLLETMRADRKNWTQADWSAASAVLSRLNARYEQVREQLPLEERLRIRSLQGEFRTLEKARDVKDVMRE
ncbi:DUF6565 domain-containing protein [Hymenobacter weizhouensis]|uniref:DUF6565 domain-containing protein n=1 Tax=Hymenobacter sp. YIM 151500-1 TaxID=2987689 RepID=UPI00222610A4|nr:DUF6565 domain-containing protein [Hymenobacter sp. YIM 151500-1]UYZ65073.1 hypothetical protein OIS53_09515 [Hymenobacter sp. YIM 151500-1]